MPTTTTPPTSTSPEAQVARHTASAMDTILKLAKTAPARGSKSEKPAVNDPALNAQIEEFIRLKHEAETAVSLRDAAEEQIISTVRPHHLDACRRAGEALTSMTVNGRLNFIQKNQYTNVPEERADDLAAAFGEQFEQLFRPTLKISLLERSANNEAVLETLLTKLGPEFFAEHFAVKRDLVVQKTFHERYCTDPQVQALAKPFVEDRTVRAYKPTLTVR
jgi:hypothetical protein